MATCVCGYKFFNGEDRHCAECPVTVLTKKLDLERSKVNELKTYMDAAYAEIDRLKSHREVLDRFNGERCAEIERLRGELPTASLLKRLDDALLQIEALKADVKVASERACRCAPSFPPSEWCPIHFIEKRVCICHPTTYQEDVATGNCVKCGLPMNKRSCDHRYTYVDPVAGKRCVSCGEDLKG